MKNYKEVITKMKNINAKIHKKNHHMNLHVICGGILSQKSIFLFTLEFIA